MFGYIIINKPELKVREYNEYMAYYCGLCRTLKGKYGIKGQISLSYDLVFLALFLTGLYEIETKEVPCRCVLHPFEKRCRKENAFLEYTADMNILLTYFKCRDDWKDEKKAGRAVYGASLKAAFERLQNEYPEKIKRIRSQFDILDQAEANGIDDIHFLSGCFGKILAEIFMYREDEWKESVEKMGIMLGRFIYILDAYEDLDEDIKKGSFNPFRKKCGNPGFDEWIRDILTLAAASCAEEFEKLPILENADIMRNILYSGIWTRYELLMSRKRK